MHVTGLILGSMLLGQVPQAATATAGQWAGAALVAQDDWSSPSGRRQAAGEQSGGASDDRYGRPAGGTGTGGASIRPPTFDAGGDSAAAPGRTDRRRRAPEMLAEAMQLSGGEASGKPLGLLAAVSSGVDRRQQFQIVLAYWRLAQAVAEYHYCLDHAKTLDSSGAFGGRAADDAAMLAARADAAAQVQEAQLGLLRAQYELAAFLQSPAGTPLPLPADRPHVGPYRTGVGTLFADRTPPEPARLADRILPVQWQQIVQQAAAMQAAEDALAAVDEDQRSGRGAVATLISCSRELLRQQRAFVRAVCEYNRNIADYKFSVVGPAATPQELVGGLILTADTLPARPLSGDGKGVRPASAEEPAHPQTFRGQPQGEPTLAPPRDEPPGSAGSDAPPADPSARLQPVGASEPELAPPQAPAPRGPADIPETRVVPVESQSPASDPFQRSAAPSSSSSAPPPSGPWLRAARKLQQPDSFSADDGRRGGMYQPGAPAAGGFGGRSDAIQSRYAALAAASPAARTRQLTAAIYGDLGVPDGTGKPIALVDCLFRNAYSDRLTTVKSYWLLRQRQAQFRTLLEQKEMLAAIEQVVIERRNDTTGPADMLRLQAARLAADAAISQARVALIEAQYALALRLGTVAEAAWPLASTAPHSGSYLLKIESQPRGIIESWPVRRLTATIPRLTEAVAGLAAAVVEADSARAAATESYRLRQGGIGAVLEGVAGQTEETSMLLTCVTEYNAAIAEYSLTVLPPGYPADKVAESLVMKP
jgi:hypothetical protein